MTGPLAWLRAHDPGFGALRRAARAAIVMPALLAFGDKVIANPTMTYFLAFGSFAMLLFVGFGGSLWDRLRAQALLGVSCAVLICLATLAAQTTVTAVVGMFLVGFAVIFSGVVSSVVASANISLLLSFILPVTLPGPVSQIPVRVAGWGLAAVVSLFAITLLWPAPGADPVAARAVNACRALARRLRAGVARVDLEADPDIGQGVKDAEYEVSVKDANAGLAELQKLFFATPYRPSGLSTEARAEIRLVDELRWLGAVVLRGAITAEPGTIAPSVLRVRLAAAGLLEEAASLLADPHRSRELLAVAGENLTAALVELEDATTTDPGFKSAVPDPDAGLEATVITSLDPSFRAQEISYVIRQIAANIDAAAAAARRSWFERLLGRQPLEFTTTLTAARERALAHAVPTSSWLHNSLRGASALSLAVLVAELTSVQHGFWVVFGTLAVLRSNALSTGQNVMRALIGTSVGFAIGGVLVALVGTNTAVLWTILPFCVLFAGLAPSAVSFAAGQAAFTLTLLVLFNLLVPVGWRLGIVRVEDVAIGGCVSLLVGLLFWPRGAGPALGRALATAYRDGAAYLASAVAYGVGCCDSGAPPVEPALPQAAGQKAAAAARRLDDTFRGYLADRGAKRIPLPEVTTLVGGVAGVRLAGDAVLDLWRQHAATGDRAAVREQLLAAATELSGWYEGFAESLTGDGAVPEPLGPNQCSDGRLAAAVADDLVDAEGHATATGVRVIWTGDHLDAVRRLQATLVTPAREAAVAAAA